MSQTFIAYALAIITVLVLGSFIRSGWKNKQRLRGTTIEALLKEKSDELDRAQSAWVVPPELQIALPRPIEYSALAVQRSRSRPRNVLCAIVVVACSVFVAAIFYGMSLSLMLQGLREFLAAPHWHPWMVVPVVVYGGGTALFLLVRLGKRHKERRLLQWGTPARAKVTATGWGGRSYCYFEYRDAAGNSYKMERNRALFPDGGAAIWTILYDPNKPTDFISYPGERYAIVGTG